MSRGRPASSAASIDAPDVVGVDVAVPQAFAAHHHDGVPDARPHLFEGPHGVVGGLEEVHDLVAQVVAAPGLLDLEPRLGQGVGDAGVGRRRDRRGRRQRTPVDDRKERVEQQEIARPAGVDHAGLGQDGELFGCPSQRFGRGTVRRLEHLDQRPVAERTLLGPFRRGSGHGEDGALDRSQHGLARRLAGRRQAPGQGRPVGVPVPSASTPVRPRSSWHRITPEFPRAPMSEPWAMALHTATIAARRPPGSATPPTAAVRRDVEALEARDAGELGHHRLQGQRHVGARVAVGHRVDVQGVERLLVESKHMPVGRHRRREVGRPEPAY